MKKKFERNGYKPYAPVRVFIGTADEEVSPQLCEKLVLGSKKLGGNVDLTVFLGATHSYNTPIKSRQQLAPNSAAKVESEKQVLAFFAETLKKR